ncbi:MAG TPA: acyltransferase [Candidatus Angelobacter sp.]
MTVTEVAPLAPALQKHTAISKPGRSPVQYNVSIGYLRAFITVLVVAHHAVLAYAPFAPPPPASLVAQPRWWQAFPVSDPQRWGGFATFVGFNDTFFMSLMFFLSGLFVWNSLQRKGAAHFLRDRVLRLGLPFALAVTLVAPLAYYPTYLQTGQHGLAGFWQQWISLGNWPSGPAWFVWVLLAFDCAAAVLFMLLPRWGALLGRLFANASRRPAVFFAILVAASAMVYIPMELAFNAFRWTEFGPFVFQTSRILHYFAYFVIAIGLGALGTGRGLLASEGKLARRWPIWAGAALIIFYAETVMAIAAFTAQSSPRMWETLADLGFTVSCAASSFAFLALFVRFARTSNRIWNSLRDNAYGMYLVHYAFVSWLQYCILKTQLSAPVKGMAVFLGAVALSWITTAALRRIPAVAKVI